MRILIVDDSRTTRAILRGMVNTMGFEAVEAVDGLDALDKLNSDDTFQIALVDWNMPNMNGYELVKSVRAQQSFARMVIIMVTTETEMSQIVKALAAGANEYVMKPFTREIIEDKFKLLGFLHAN